MASRVDGAIVRGIEEGRSVRGAEKVRESMVDLIHLVLGGQSAAMAWPGRVP